MGVAYSRIDSGEAAEQLWLRAKEMEPDNPNFKNYDSYLAQYYYRRGMKAGAQQDFDEAVSDLEKAVTYAPSNAEMWYNLGGAYFTQKQYDSARKSWERSLALNPNLKQAQQGLLALPPSGQSQ
jgi:tetratricopeptide (TPR) repeat protein